MFFLKKDFKFGKACVLNLSSTQYNVEYVCNDEGFGSCRKIHYNVDCDATSGVILWECNCGMKLKASCVL